jgi:hypothetical protein
MTLNSTGLGVGVASPSFNIHARGTTDGRIQVEGASGYGMVFIQASSGNSAQLQLNSNGGSGRRYVVASNTSGQFLIGDETAVATRLTIDSSGNVGISVTPSAGKGCLQLSSGINFPATQVASSDANTLDDYEEGTWTIGLTFGGGSTGMTTATNIGRYTKIGRQVTVSGNLSLSNKGSSTGIAEIQGLPFTIANANEAYSAANVRFNGVSFADIPISIGAIGSTKILLQEITKAGVVTDITDADFTNTSSCIIGFTYTV